MAALEHEIAQFLALNSLGVIGTDLFYGGLPDSPDSCITVLSPTGSGSVHASATVQYVSILLRGTDYTTVGALADLVYLMVHNVENLLNGVVGAAHVVGFSKAERIPMFVGRDPQGRCLWSISTAMNVSVV